MSNYSSSDDNYKSANLFLRFIAFLLDFFLIFLIAVFFLGKYHLPVNYSKEIKIIRQHFEKKENADGKEQAFDLQKDVNELAKNAELFKMFEEVNRILFFIAWIYFSVMGIFSQGSSIGKRVFNMTVIKEDRQGPLRFLDNILRSGIKVVSIFSVLPLLLANVLPMFFSKNRKSGHDFLCKTIVIQDPNSSEE